MSDRDELARAIMNAAPIDETDGGWRVDHDYTARALWAAGWRKRPDVAEIVAVLDDDMNWDQGELSPVLLLEQTAHAILALMDGPTETGESK